MLNPGNIEEIQEALRNSTSLIPVGGNTKSALTAAPDHFDRISTNQLSGVIEYDPSEFTITVLAGTPLSEVQATLREQGQYLPFDPPLAAAGATIGGTVAAGLSGPGAYRFGPIRDFLIGVRYLDSDARIITGGGKVVKNAAGFDTPKFLIGSLGRLGILLELTFKVFPEPEARATFSIEVNDSEQAAKLIPQLNRSSFDLEALDFISDIQLLRGRLAGNAKAIEKRLDRIAEFVDQPGNFERLSQDEANAFWQEQLDFSWCDSNLALAKFAITPSSIKDYKDWAVHYSIGGNVAWVNAPLNQLTELNGFSPGLLIRNPNSKEESIWTKPRPASQIEDALKKTLDKQGKFPSLGFAPSS